MTCGGGGVGGGGGGRQTLGSERGARAGGARRQCSAVPPGGALANEEASEARRAPPPAASLRPRRLQPPSDPPHPTMASVNAAVYIALVAVVLAMLQVRAGGALRYCQDDGAAAPRAAAPLLPPSSGRVTIMRVTRECEARGRAARAGGRGLNPTPPPSLPNPSVQVAAARQMLNSTSTDNHANHQH